MQTFLNLRKKLKKKSKNTADTMIWKNSYTEEATEVTVPKYEHYLQITKESKESHAKKEKEVMIPWKNPFSGKIVIAPASQYQHYLTTTAEKEKEDKSKAEMMKLEEIKKGFKKQLENYRKEIADMKSKFDKKEKQGKYHLNTELKKFQNKDELENFQKLKQKSETFAETIGLRPEDLPVKDKVILEEEKLKTDVVSECIKILLKNTDENESKVNKLMWIFIPIIHKGAKYKLDKKRLQQLQMKNQGMVPREIPRSKGEIDKMLNNLVGIPQKAIQQSQQQKQSHEKSKTKKIYVGDQGGGSLSFKRIRYYNMAIAKYCKDEDVVTEFRFKKVVILVG